ncbi:hypothetical protein ZHAS_00021007 [Anopheles sinensis]|uniref:Uncharacterized protein n=1 Tax=Anopheles sinensis TaxID=74873 RepID=A0A084WRA0_ANOSI|nr:hypothetical protein ZHAS_00021007 [Anopheles sinensis]
MSLPHDDGDSRSSRVGDSTIDVLVLPEQLTRQSPVPDGGGYRDRDGGGMWESDSNHIGSGGGFNCEQDVRSGGGDLSDCAHWRGSNRQPLQPQLSSSVYRVGCPAGDGFRSRQESDVARMPNQPRSLGVQAVEEQVENSVMLVFAEPGDRYGTVMLKVVPDYCGAVLTAPFSEQRHIEPSTHNNGPALESIDHRQRERDALRLQSWWHGGNHRKRFIALLLSEFSGRKLMAKDFPKAAQLRTKNPVSFGYPRIVVSIAWDIERSSGTVIDVLELSFVSGGFYGIVLLAYLTLRLAIVLFKAEKNLV